MGWSRSFGTEPVDLITTGLRPELRCTWNLIVRPELEFEKIDVQDYDALDEVRKIVVGDFGAKVQDESIVIDKNIITSTGPSAGFKHHINSCNRAVCYFLLFV